MNELSSTQLHYLLYKVVNKLNGHYYIGKHQTTDINDNYYGSGLYIKKAIKKYGLENFSKEILEECNTLDELNQLEELCVQLSNCFPYDPMRYNLKVGGSGGSLSGEFNPLHGKHFTELHKQNISKALTGKPKTDLHKQHLRDQRANESIDKKQQRKEKRRHTLANWSDEKQKQVSKNLQNARLNKTKEELEDWNNKISQTLLAKTPEQREKTYAKFINTLTNHTEEEKQQIFENRSNGSKGKKVSEVGKQNMKKASQKLWNDPIKRKQMLDKREKTYAKKSKEEIFSINQRKGSGGNKHVLTSIVKLLTKNVPHSIIKSIDFSQFPIEEYKKISKDQKTSRKLFLEKWIYDNFSITINLVSYKIRVTNGVNSKVVDKHNIPDGYYPGMCKCKEGTVRKKII